MSDTQSEQLLPESDTELELIRVKAERASNLAMAAAQSADTARESANAAIANGQIAKDNAEAIVVNAQKANDNVEAISVSTQKINAIVEKVASDAQIASTHMEAISTNLQLVKDDVETSKNSIDLIKQYEQESIDNTRKTNESMELSASYAEQAKDSLKTVESLKDLGQNYLDAAKGSAEESQKQAAISEENALNSQENSENSSAYAVKAQKEMTKAEEARKQAEVEAKNAALAHNLSVTVGLAGAFNEKAIKAKQNLFFWSAALSLALSAIVWIGWVRYDSVTTLITSLILNQALMATIITEILLFLSSVAAPIWFAWVATKMTSKYFHLSEDYSYKASIAKAYLGFKEQASGLDPIFQERLFAAAITQLDANPLRFFATDTHAGSPLQDLLQQPFMQQILQNKTFKDEFVSWMNKVFKTNFYVPKINLLTGKVEKPEPGDVEE